MVDARVFASIHSSVELQPTYLEVLPRIYYYSPYSVPDEADAKPTKVSIGRPPLLKRPFVWRPGRRNVPLNRVHRSLNFSIQYSVSNASSSVLCSAAERLDSLHLIQHRFFCSSFFKVPCFGCIATLASLSPHGSPQAGCCLAGRKLWNLFDMASLTDRYSRVFEALLPSSS